MRSISILGATGSVGEQTLDLVRRNPAEWNVVALTANSNVAALAASAREFGAQVAVVADESRLVMRWPEAGSKRPRGGVPCAKRLRARST